MRSANRSKCKLKSNKKNEQNTTQKVKSPTRTERSQDCRPSSSANCSSHTQSVF